MEYKVIKNKNEIEFIKDDEKKLDYIEMVRDLYKGNKVGFNIQKNCGISEEETEMILELQKEINILTVSDKRKKLIKDFERNKR